MRYSPSLQLAKDHAAVLSKLDGRERTYVACRVQGSPPMAAAQIAGYGDFPGAAKRLEANPKVQAAMHAAVRTQLLNRQITKQDVINGLMDAVHASGNATELVAAWREIGKIIGAYAPIKVETKTRKEDLKCLPDHELINLTTQDYEVLDFV